MLNAPQLRDLVIRPTLYYLGDGGSPRWSPAAEALLLATAYHESGLCYLEQLGGGPALGIYQIEPATHRDVWESFLAYRPTLGQYVSRLIPLRSLDEPGPCDEELVGNLPYATAIARLVYWRAPDPLPDARDLDGLAAYWKRWYNTPAGRGHEGVFRHNAEQLADIIGGF